MDSGSSLKAFFAHRYLVALASVAVLVPPGYPLFLLFDRRFPLQYFLIAVAFSAWNGGFGPGVLATFTGAFAGLFLFLPGRGQGMPSDVFDVARVVIYLSIGVTISVFSHVSRKRGEELKRAYRVRDEILSNLSHELRTPLNAIIGFSDLLAGAELPDKEREGMVEAIARNGRRLHRLVENLLSLSQIGRNEIPLVRAVDPRAALTAIGRDFETVAKNKGLTFRLDVDASVPGTLRLDSRALEQVLFNLVDNAFKFTVTGGVTLAARMRDRQRGATLQVSVRDTGSGIPDSFKPRLFEAFAQADASPTRSHGGTGVGLALCRDVARSVGGDVHLVASDAAQGTEFVLELPADAGSIDPASSATT